MVAPGVAPSDRSRERGLEGLLAGRSLTHQRWGLERVRAVLRTIGSPEHGWVSLHLAGTNGKGSAAAMAAAVLEAAGWKVGLFTSPHLVDVSERILWRGRPAPTDVVDACADMVREAADRVGATYFESLTAVAFLAFAELGAERVVAEVGMGGRLDATNILIPAACAITSISLDHANELGRTPRAIATEKAGILKRGVPAVLGPLPRSARRAVEKRARELRATLFRLGREARLEDVQVDAEGTSFLYRSKLRPKGWRLRIPLAGAHQARNAAVALLLLEAAGEAAEEAEVRMGLSGVRWPGRFQVLRHPEGTWVLDGAHNPAAMSALSSTLAAVDLPKPAVFVLSILDDKPWRAMLRALPAELHAVILTVAASAPAERSWDPRAASRALRAAGGPGRAEGASRTPRVEIEPDLDRAMMLARELAGNGTVVVAGSFTVVGDALARLGCSPERS